ncbi:MAG: hypothetical protein Q8K82_17250 [Gemmatimonadaceae bacterium]|nr:hypothetical protein [Gemmatimonadaceae bacterium]
MTPRTLRISTNGRLAIAMVGVVYPEALEPLALLYHARRLRVDCPVRWVGRPADKLDRLYYAAWRALGENALDGVNNRAGNVSMYWQRLTQLPSPTPAFDTELEDLFSPAKHLGNLLASPLSSARTFAITHLAAIA